MLNAGILCGGLAGAVCEGVIFLRFIVALCLLCAVAPAQEVQPLLKAVDFLNSLVDPPKPKPGFVRIAEVNRVFTTPGSAERAVKFTGVVIQSVPSQNYVFVQEGTEQGIQVALAKDVPVPALGDEVEVEAKAKFIAATGDSWVTATAIRVTGNPGVTAPLKPKLADINTGKYNRRAVEVEAVVLHSFFIKAGPYAGHWLLLSDDEGACLGGIYGFPEGWSAAHLPGKRVRFRGVGMPGGDFMLRGTSPEDVTVLGDAVDGSALRPLTTAKEVAEYGAGATRAKVLPVVLRGVCTYSGSTVGRFFFHDGTAGLQVNCPDGQVASYGDAVTIVGTTLATGNNAIMRAFDAQVTGKTALPPPEKIRLNGPPPPYAAWVEVEGLVVSAQEFVRNRSTYFHIVGDNTMVRVFVPEPPPTPPGGWWGARLRMSGVFIPEMGVFAYSRVAEQASVITPGTAGPFDIPAATTAAAMKVAPPSANRIRMAGTVTDYRDGYIYLRDETGSFRADTAPHAAPGAGFRGLPGDVPWVVDPKPGDQLDLVGSPMAENGTLRYANIRLRSQREAPTAHPVKFAAAVNGDAANDLVTLRGRLVEYTSGFVADNYSSKRWREMLRLEEGSESLEVVFENADKTNAFAAYLPNDLIEATGIVRYEGGVPTYRLRARTPNDVRTLGPDPSVMRGKIVRIGITAAALLTAALAWVWLTRRTVTLRTAQLAAANKQLDVALSQEREIGELKTRFVSLVSHEFRTPLGVTMSAVELLRHYRERLPAEELDQLLGDIHSATIRMSGMMEQILLLGRVEAGKLAITKAPLILAELTDKLRDETLSATNRKCPIEYVVENDISGATGDEALLRHIFSNLLSNAIKYSPPQSPVQFRICRKGNNAIFTIQDSGIGIPEKDQARLFEAFQRAGNVGEREGTGLGLLIVKRCVDLHSGTIAMQSAEGKGTTFVVTLPLFA